MCLGAVTDVVGIAVVDRPHRRSGRQQAANVGEGEDRVETEGLGERAFRCVALAGAEAVEPGGRNDEALWILRDMGTNGLGLRRKMTRDVDIVGRREADSAQRVGMDDRRGEGGGDAGGFGQRAVVAVIVVRRMGDDQVGQCLFDQRLQCADESGVGDKAAIWKNRGNAASRGGGPQRPWPPRGGYGQARPDRRRRPWRHRWRLRIPVLCLNWPKQQARRTCKSRYRPDVRQAPVSSSHPPWNQRS